MGLELGGPESRSTTPLNWPDWDRVWDFLEAGGGGSWPTVGWLRPTCWTGLKQMNHLMNYILVYPTSNVFDFINILFQVVTIIGFTEFSNFI